MKQLFGILLVALATCVLFVQARKIEPPIKNDYQAVDTVVTYTADARAIIDRKCFGCHNPESKAEKAKKKLMWDELPKLSKAKQLKTVNDMLEVLSEGSMPPEKFLATKPEAKLTDEEKATLFAWAEANTKKLN